MMHFLLLISRQGKVRLAKWFSPVSPKERTRIVREVCAVIIGRSVKLCNVVDFGGQRLVFRRYASLHFVCSTDKEDNELLSLEQIHHFVEVLDKYFGNVCELDLIFNFHKAYFLLDEVFLNGEVQETSKKAILKYAHMQEALLEELQSTNSAAAALLETS
jgi:AP-1 complex subunit sigma 1/2